MHPVSASHLISAVQLCLQLLILKLLPPQNVYYVYYLSLHPKADLADDSNRLVSAVDFYFIEEDSSR